MNIYYVNYYQEIIGRILLTGGGLFIRSGHSRRAAWTGGRWMAAQQAEYERNQGRPAAKVTALATWYMAQFAAPLGLAVRVFFQPDSDCEKLRIGLVFFIHHTLFLTLDCCCLLGRA